MLLYIPFTIFPHTVIFILIYSFPSFSFALSTFNYNLLLVLSLLYIIRRTFFITLCCAFSSVDIKQIVLLIYLGNYCIFLAPCGRNMQKETKDKKYKERSQESGREEVGVEHTMCLLFSFKF